MIRRFTIIVEEFLHAGKNVKENKINEYDFALDVKLEARDTIQAMAGTIQKCGHHDFLSLNISLMITLFALLGTYKIPV